MAELATPPFPPGDYPVVVVGSGPGGLQASYSLRRRGIDHAVLSADPAPGGMFRRFPLFQRLLSWSKPHAPAERGTRPYQWFDWNSLLAAPEHRVLVADFLEGDSHYPTRPEMERALAAFAERAELAVRYECRWEATRREEDRFVLETSDGEYRARLLVLAVGMAEPWMPDIEGGQHTTHYADTGPPQAYADKRVFVIGKQNSGFEVADGLLAWARQIVLASPSPTRFSIMTRSLAGARTRYVQPYEDHVLGAGTFALDAAILRVERTAGGFRVSLQGTTVPGALELEMDAVIAATGFSTPLGDLRRLGVETVARDRLPALTPFWESATVPGIYFAGTVTQAARGLKKYGVPSNSGAVQGFRYNAEILARHLARTHFGLEEELPTLEPEDVAPFLLGEATRGPELLNQKGYLARVVTLDPERGIVDEGVLPLVHFLDAGGPDAIAMTVESDGQEIRPAVYVRAGGGIDEHVLETHPLLDFETPAHRAQLEPLVEKLLRR